MENDNKTPQPEQQKHPKPTDDVQLKIETVTPETAKQEVEENASTEENETQAKAADDQEEKPVEKPTENSTQQQDESEEAKDGENHDDKRDDIETISP